VTLRADLQRVESFLPCATPDQWLEAALSPEREVLLLTDHANCEKKAASTALSLMHRYANHLPLLNKMSRLAREELRHFEQVLDMLAKRGLEYQPLSASRYAQGLHAGVRKSEPGRLVDVLIVGALIEARSCERFARLAPELDPSLGAFYTKLLQSEARHFMDYLKLAEHYCDAEEMSRRLDHFKALEAALIEDVDEEFRFHSGPLAELH
jgi:tRNA-(ms[2]io[6]A)-hydroxylase